MLTSVPLSVSRGSMRVFLVSFFSCQGSINAFLIYMSTSFVAVLTPLDSQLIGPASTSLLLTISGVGRAGARIASFQALLCTNCWPALILPGKLRRSLRSWFNLRYLGKQVALSAYIFNHQGELWLPHWLTALQNGNKDTKNKHQGFAFMPVLCCSQLHRASRLGDYSLKADPSVVTQRRKWSQKNQLICLKSHS